MYSVRFITVALNKKSSFMLNFSTFPLKVSNQYPFNFLIEISKDFRRLYETNESVTYICYIAPHFSRPRFLYRSLVGYVVGIRNNYGQVTKLYS